MSARPEAQLCMELWDLYEQACEYARRCKKPKLRKHLVTLQYEALENYFDAEERLTREIEDRRNRAHRRARGLTL